jgi:hypothetical protein
LHRSQREGEALAAEVLDGGASWRAALQQLVQLLLARWPPAVSLSNPIHLTIIFYRSINLAINH